MTSRARSRRSRRALAVVVLCAGSASPGHATIVERVVAVVEDRAVLLSDLVQRARPRELQLFRQVEDAASRAVAVHEVRRQTLERMVDEILELQVARRTGVSVSAEEVERAVVMQAQANGITVPQLEQEVVATGLTLKDYRRELSSQLLGARLASLHGQARNAPVRDADLRDTYRRLQLEEQRQLPIRVAGIRIAIPSSAEPSPIESERELARSLIVRARCPSSLPAFESAKGQLAARVQTEEFLRVRSQWLEGLRRRAHVDIRR